MLWRFVFEHRSAYILILVPSSLRTTLFVLVPRDETRRWAISSRWRIGNFVKKPHRNGCPPIVGRIERTRSTFTIGTATFTCGFSRRTKSRVPEIRSRGTEPEIRRIFCPAPTSPGKRRIQKAVTNSTEYLLDRPGPFREDPGATELIIRRVHTRRGPCICHWARLPGRDRQPFPGQRWLKGARPGETNSTNLFICIGCRG